MRDPGERPQHKDDFPDEDTNGQDEPPVDSPPTPGGSTATGLPGPDSEGQKDVETEEWKRVKEKNRPVSPEQSTSALINTNSDAAPREAERDHDDKSPVHFDSETKNDEIAVDVALPEEPTGMSEESGRGWITEEAFFTISPGWQQMRQRKEVKMNHLSPAEKREFPKRMQTEWQASSRAKQPGYYLRKKRSKPERAGRIVRWTLVGCALGSQRKAGHRGAVQKRDLSLRVLQTLTSLTSSHIPRHSPVRVL